MGWCASRIWRWLETVDRVTGIRGWICKFEAGSEILELDSRFRGIRKICGRWPGLKIILETEFRDFGGRIRQIGCLNFEFGGYGFKFLTEYITWFARSGQDHRIKKTLLCHVSLQRGSQILTIITDRYQSVALDKSVLYTE